MMLTLPVMVRADETVIPPEANWTPYPPAQGIIDEQKLMKLLVEKGLITPQQAARVKITPQEAAQLSRASDIVMRSGGGARGGASGN